MTISNTGITSNGSSTSNASSISNISSIRNISGRIIASIEWVLTVVSVQHRLFVAFNALHAVYVEQNYIGHGQKR